ncbi:chemotaxis protein CheX [Paenibacillus sp. IB182496]|uniref:Chemotaxis protein CheX n=1 Tax=Paenibacillus sabuli TaxID=2772509 RepID=A0A927BXX9_9BACL|nr:chemotaxis protein CheX [Paenibacillus sabuli]MBD2847373.1 chemotaxis protein CheX [Paenibacillus sabuli]
MKLGEEYYAVVTRVGSNVLSGYLGMEVTPHAAREQDSSGRYDIAVQIRVLGQLDGQIVCVMNEHTAKQVVGRMFGGIEVETLDEMGWSAIKEFGNWFVSGIATEFANKGWEVNISHPLTTFEDPNASQDLKDIRSIVMPLESEYGMIEIHSILESRTLI